MSGVTEVNYGSGPFWATVSKSVPLSYTLRQPYPSPRFEVPQPQTVTAVLIPVKSVTETLGVPGQWVERDQMSFNDEL